MTSHRDYLTPDLVQMIWTTPCLTDGCYARQEHWTVEHQCELCHQLGHSHQECQKPEALKILKILINLQFDPQRKDELMESASAQQIQQEVGLIPLPSRTRYSSSSKPTGKFKRKLQFLKNRILANFRKRQYQRI